MNYRNNLIDIPLQFWELWVGKIGQNATKTKLQ